MAPPDRSLSAHSPKRVAIIGGGITGLSAAWHLGGLAKSAQPPIAVTLFESEPRLGGHANTVDITLPGPGSRSDPVTAGVDTGFLVFNHATYPGLSGFFKALDVPISRSEMSFSVQLDDWGAKRNRRLEWSGRSPLALWAQWGNIVSPQFWHLLREIVRFNREATQVHQSGRWDQGRSEGPSLDDFLREHRFTPELVQAYLLPMLACIWSCPEDQMLRFPLSTMLRFCHNHGLLTVADQPPWLTVQGGSREYVRRVQAWLTADRHGPHRVRVNTPILRVERQAQGGVLVHPLHGAAERFDAVVLATHAPQARALLAMPGFEAWQQALAPLRTQRNRALLHTDTGVMPRARRAWSSWNFDRRARRVGPAGLASAGAVSPEPAPNVCLHYWINRLQPLPFARDVLVSLNPNAPLDQRQVLGEFDYAHPVFDAAAERACASVKALQGDGQVWVGGAWSGFGFHEDGFQSGRVCAEAVWCALNQPWQAAA